VVITNEIGSYEFVEIKKETFLLNEFLTLVNVVRLVCERLDWMVQGCEVQFEGPIDIGSSNRPQMKTMSPVYNVNEWTTYVGVMIKSEIRRIELIAKMDAWNNVGDKSSQSPTLSKVVDEQNIEYGIVLTQPTQKTQDDTDAEEPPFVASNKTMLNVEHVCGSVGVSDIVVDMGFISGVDHLPIATGFTPDVDLSFIESELMPEYEATFRNERAEDSADDRPIPELSNRDKALLQPALAELAPEMLDYRDLSQAHSVVADGLRFDDSVPLINHDNANKRKGIIFNTMEAMEIWLVEYAVFHHRLFMVKHSDENKRYAITYRRGCPWTVHARKRKDGS
jgi:hypothetical protein